MFICIKGHNSDGHEYIKEALNNGARVIVAEQVRDECVGGAATVLVKNTRRVAALLYNVQCDEPTKGLKIIGVTGTNGKTSVCAMLESIFMCEGIRCAVLGTTGCRIDGEDISLCCEGLTTPDAAQLYPVLSFMKKEGVTHVLMEVSSHALALSRVDAIEFEYGIFTNLSRDHLDFHGDMEDYFLTKSRLIERSRRCVVNVDDEYGARYAEMCKAPITCSEKKGDAVAKDVKCTANGCSYKLLWKDIELEISVSALGDFSVMNSLEAAALALDMGISPYAVSRGLLRFFGAKGRMERAVTTEPYEVIVDYAHTPDALERLIMSARVLRGEQGRIILVFGCGGDRDRGKRKLMAGIASRLCDEVIITSDNSRSENTESIISDILKGIDKEKPYTVIPSRARAIEYAVSIARAGDVVLLAGKGHEKYEIDADGKHSFDEISIVREAVAAKNRE
jgi:UDP-N-acetylmuramyl-tripeptide synthetase